MELLSCVYRGLEMGYKLTPCLLFEAEPVYLGLQDKQVAIVQQLS